MENNQNNNFQPQPQKTDEMAIASLVLGLVSLFGYRYIHLLTIICAILAIVFANLAKSRIYASRNRLTGIGMANAGMILGIIALVLYVLMLAACGALLGSYMYHM